MLMIISTKVYAEALYQVGVETRNPMEFYNALQTFQEFLNDEEFYRIMTATFLDQDALEPVWSELGKTFPQEVVKFLKMIQDAKLMSDFDRIVREYRDFLEEGKHLNVVEVTSPNVLSENEKEQLMANLKLRYEGVFEIDYNVDASLIKGLVVRVNHDIYDTSIKSKLDRILNQGGLENE
ncbi:ATP synthase F1 subunit delta [Erysipelothrix sp. P66]|uniref:ATP synthase F1 subunit delta n=1 Tax=Erysipelothrix sp. P66 TaxID=3141531 RepID=UPI00315C92DC